MRRDELRVSTPKLIAIAAILGSYGLARLPASPEPERQALAARFRFTREPLPELPGLSTREVREVNPSTRRIAAWISAVGAAVTLADLDGDGLPNDVAYVDPRVDRVIVVPAPGTGTRYEPFALDADPLPYDPGTTAPMGCVCGDLDEDGKTDLVVYYWGRTPVAFLHRGRDGESLSGRAYERSEIVPERSRWFTNAATFADLDGDGHLDLLVANYFPDDAAVLDPRAYVRQDMQASMSRAGNGGIKHLLRWTPGRSPTGPGFEFVETRGILEPADACGWTLAVGAADLDGDLLPEIYLANDFGPDRLLHNRSRPGAFQFVRVEGTRGFTTPASKVVGRDSFKGMGVDFGDLDGDGVLDLFVSNIADAYALQESHFAFIGTGSSQPFRRGVAPFVDRSEALGLSRSGWGWDAKIADFDNDGASEVVQAVGFLRGEINRWPELQELAMGNDELLHDSGSWPRFTTGDDLSGHARNPFWVRTGSGAFVDVAAELDLAEPGVSRGVATADVDGDGRLDLAIANQWAPSSFYRNDAPRPGRFLGLRLLLPLREGEVPRTVVLSGHPVPGTPGRPAVGAEVNVKAPGGLRLLAQVDGGNGHSGRRAPEILLGLGDIEPQSRLTVQLRWRDPAGRVRREQIELTPGWHTLLLAWPRRGSSEEHP